MVRIYEANTFTFNGNRYCYIAMEYVEGCSLDKYLEKEVRFSVDLALDIQKDICNGLAQAHGLEPPVVHRDVKPQNIMVAMSGKKNTAKVSDFGLARHVDAITRLTEAAGTLAYLPPEGFWNYETAASDVFSAGIIFYLMITGISPFKVTDGYKYTQKDEAQVAIRESRNKIPECPSKYNKDLDMELDNIVLKALSPDIKKRYKDASEFLKAINHYKASKNISTDEDIQKAMTLGKQYGTLREAIKLLEDSIARQSLEKQQLLNEKYGSLLRDWKKGIIM